MEDTAYFAGKQACHHQWLDRAEAAVILRLIIPGSESPRSPRPAGLGLFYEGVQVAQ